MTILFICRQRGLRISTATASITLMWRQHGHVVGCDRSVGRRTTALPPFLVRTLPDPQEPTLTVFHNGTPIFTSHGKWLHPLFELEAYLADHTFQSDNLILQDKIIGKAAALLIHRLGFRTVKAGILSKLGEAVLLRRGISYTYEQLVQRIHCQTEELLATVEDPEAAYRLVKIRARR